MYKWFQSSVQRDRTSLQWLIEANRYKTFPNHADQLSAQNAYEMGFPQKAIHPFYVSLFMLHPVNN